MAKLLRCDICGKLSYAIQVTPDVQVLTSRFDICVEDATKLEKVIHDYVESRRAKP